jgi:hypothetical protein
MSEKTITLGGQPFTITALPLGKLRKVIPAISHVSVAMSRVSADSMLDEAVFSSVAVALSVCLGKTLDEVEAMPMSLDEIIQAVTAIAEVCGLAAKPAASGEAQPGTSGTSLALTSTPSTDSSLTS